MVAVFTKDTPTEREFDCKCCGDHVIVKDRKDHRMCFCSAYCEREYWRHRDRYDRKKDISRGHVTYLSKEHSENMREAGMR